jgi:threonine synthase
VKLAFADEKINEKLLLTSANSINVARWLPQQIYYLLAYKQWLTQQDEKPVICVPSGNFEISVLGYWLTSEDCLLTILLLPAMTIMLFLNI